MKKKKIKTYIQIPKNQVFTILNSDFFCCVFFYVGFFTCQPCQCQCPLIFILIWKELSLMFLSWYTIELHYLSIFIKPCMRVNLENWKPLCSAPVDFYTDSRRESLYIVFAPAFFESWLFLCLFFLPFFLFFFFFLCVFALFWTRDWKINQNSNFLNIWARKNLKTVLEISQWT